MTECNQSGFGFEASDRGRSWPVLRGGNRFRWRGVSAPGYENINDREQPRNDPVFGILAGRDEPDEPLAGRDTEFLLEANVHPVELTDSDSRRSQCGVFRSSQQRQPRKNHFRRPQAFRASSA